MSQSNGINQLKRVEFEFKGKVYCFALNPEEYQQTEPSRTTIVQTRGGAFIDAWGAGLVEISFKGTTGLKNRTNNANNGFHKFVELRNLLRDVYNDVKPGAVAKDILKFYNYTDEEYWAVYPDRFTLMRSKSKPLLYMYDIKLIGIQRLGSLTGSPHGRVGNPYRMNSTRSARLDTSYNSGTRWLKQHKPGYFGRAGSPPISEELPAVLPGDTEVTPSNFSLFYVSEGIKFPHNYEFTDTVRQDLQVIQDNLQELLGGSNGKVSPVVAKTLTTNLTVLKSGVLPNVSVDIIESYGAEPIGFVNQWDNDTLYVYQSLVDYDTRVIETGKYMSHISVYLPQVTKNKVSLGIQYQQLIAMLLNQGNKLNDSSLMQVLESYNLNLNYETMIKSVIINSIKVYNCLYTAISKESYIRCTCKQLDILINNIKYVTCLLEDYELKPLDLLKELRKLHININTLRGIPQLFDNSTGGDV